MGVSATNGGDNIGAPGTNRNPAKFAQVLDLFHQMVAVVKLERILHIDIGVVLSKPGIELLASDTAILLTDRNIAPQSLTASPISFSERPIQKEKSS